MPFWKYYLMQSLWKIVWRFIEEMKVKLPWVIPGSPLIKTLCFHCRVHGFKVQSLVGGIEFPQPHGDVKKYSKRNKTKSNAVTKAVTQLLNIQTGMGTQSRSQALSGWHTTHAITGALSPCTHAWVTRAPT